MNRLHIVLYLRISLEDTQIGQSKKVESNSISNQRALLEDFVKQDPELSQGVVTILEDDGFSGTNFDRPSVKKLLDMVTKKEVNCIIVKDFSRFGRNELEVSDYLDQIFPKYLVRFISINDAYDSKNHLGRTCDTMVTFRQILNAYYSKDLSKKVRTAKRQLAEQGEFLSPMPPFGYVKSSIDHHQLVIEPNSAKIVRLVFELAQQGNTPLEIAQKMNQQGIGTCSSFKNEIGIHYPWKINNGKATWNNSTVKKILNDTRYLGCLVYGKQKRIEVGRGTIKKVDEENWIVVPNTHEPLVTQDVFDQVQQKLEKRPTNVNCQKRTYLFSGKIICHVCSHVLQRTGTRNGYWRCVQPKFDATLSCCRESIIEAELAEKVYKIIEIYLKSLEHELKPTAPPENSIKALEKEIKIAKAGLDRLQTQKRNLYESYMDEKITKDKYLSERDVFQEKLDELHQFMENKEILLREERNILKKQQEMEEKTLLEKFTQSNTLTREMVEAFIQCIYIYPDKSIEIVWKFSDLNIND